MDRSSETVWRCTFAHNALEFCQTTYCEAFLCAHLIRRWYVSWWLTNYCFKPNDEYRWPEKQSVSHGETWQRIDALIAYDLANDFVWNDKIFSFAIHRSSCWLSPLFLCSCRFDAQQRPSRRGTYLTLARHSKVQVLCLVSLTLPCYAEDPVQFWCEAPKCESILILLITCAKYFGWKECKNFWKRKTIEGHKLKIDPSVDIGMSRIL